MKPVLLFPLLLLFVCYGFTQTVRYVKPSPAGNGDGSSWTNASADLQAMINASSTGDAIWVAAGTYIPNRRADNVHTITPADLHNAFVPKSGIALFGGFAGHETDLLQRKKPAHGIAEETILSGDLNGNDAVSGSGSTLNLQGYDDNLTHVLVLSGIDNITIDGFTIRGGRERGGIAPVVNGFPLKNDIGTGIFSIHCTQVSIRNCFINYNLGNAVYWYMSGGSIEHSQFRRNKGSLGGGIRIDNAAPVISHCIFSENSANGGGMWINSGIPVISHCTISYNYAANSGGGILNSNGSPIIINCVINDNQAGTQGGGIFNDESGDYTISNTTFSFNRALMPMGMQGHAIGGNYGGPSLTKTVTLNNCIVWAWPSFTGNNVLAENYGRYVLNNCLLQYGGSGYNITGTYLNQDPQFLNAALPAGFDGILLTNDDGLQLNATSPGMDAGSSALIPAGLLTDIRGTARITGPQVDMGAYENMLNFTVLHVDGNNGNDNNAGTSWGYPLKTLKQAITIAQSTHPEVDSILVGKGTYYPGGLAANSLWHQAFSITGGGIKLFGGYDPATGSRNTETNPTILSGATGTAAITDNSAHIMVIANIPANADSIVIDGFTFSDGYAQYTPDQTYNGITIENSYGGALYTTTVLNGNKTSIRNCRFINNSSADRGGAWYNVNSAPLITNCIFTNNNSKEGGALFHETNETMIVHHSEFRNNTAQMMGGSLLLGNNSNAHIINSLFAGGNAYSIATGTGSTVTIDNSTIADNTAGAMNNMGSSTVQHSIFMNNATGIAGSGGTTIHYSLVQGYNGGTGNLDGHLITDAGFADRLSGNYRLQVCSPVINKGTLSLMPPGLLKDLDNNERLQLGLPDLGAYEASSQGNNFAPALATGMVSTTQYQTASDTTFYMENCHTLIAAVAGNASSTAITGNTTIRSWVETNQPAHFVKRHIEITPASNGTTATGKVILYFTQQEFDDFNAVNTLKLPVAPGDAAGIANLLIEKRGGASTDGTGLPDTYPGAVITINPADADINWNSITQRWEISFHTAGFSGFFVKTQLQALPLQLISFTGKAHAGDIHLKWVTAGELNTRHFEVERSESGAAFTGIGTVQANGSGGHSYHFTDRYPTQGKIFYRLKIVDIDGAVEYSPIVIMQLSKATAILIYPNPVRDQLIIRYQNPALTGTIVQLLDAQGRQLLAEKLSSTQHVMQLAGIKAGIYFLRFQNGEQQTLIKQD